MMMMINQLGLDCSLSSWARRLKTPNRSSAVSQVQGVSKKTSFCQNWPWQILLLIMKNPLSFFMTNVCDSFCNSYICIIWLGYIYPTLAKRYLLWLHVEVFGRPLCATPLSSCYWSSPELKTSCANPWLPSHLEPLHLEIGQQSLPGAQAESSWYPSSCGTPLQERITEADWIAALEASLFWNHYLGQKNTTSSLKNNKTIWEKFITCARTFTCCERRAWCFTCISKSFISISHCQQ